MKWLEVAKDQEKVLGYRTCREAVLILCYGLCKTFGMERGRKRSPFDTNLFFSFQSLHCTPATILLALGSVWRRKKERKKKRQRERDEVEGTEILEQSADRAQLEKRGLFYSAYKLWKQNKKTPSLQSTQISLLKLPHWLLSEHLSIDAARKSRLYNADPSSSYSLCLSCTATLCFLGKRKHSAAANGSNRTNLRYVILGR